MKAGELAEGHAPLRGAVRGGGVDRWVRAALRRFPPATLIRASGARGWHGNKFGKGGLTIDSDSAAFIRLGAGSPSAVTPAKLLPSVN